MRVSGLAVTISVRFSIDEVTVQPHFRFANKSTRGHNSPISRRIHGHALPGKATVEYRPFNIPVEFAFLDSGIARPGLRGRAFLLASLESSQKPPSSPSPVLILLRGSKGEGQRWAACVPPPRTCMCVFRHSVGSAIIHEIIALAKISWMSPLRSFHRAPSFGIILIRHGSLLRITCIGYVFCAMTSFEAIDFKAGNIHIYIRECREIFIIRRYGEGIYV